MHLRETRPEDRPAIERISRVSFDRVYAFFSIRGSRQGWPQLILEDDGAVVAFLAGRLFDGRPPVGNKQNSHQKKYTIKRRHGSEEIISPLSRYLPPLNL